MRLLPARVHACAELDPAPNVDRSVLTEASVARHELRGGAFGEEERSAPERRDDEPARPIVGGAEPGGAGEVAQAAPIEYETCFLRERGLVSEEAGEPWSLVGGVEGGVDAARPVGAAAGASGAKGVANGSAAAGTSSITFKRTSWRGISSAAADAEAAVATEEQPNAAAALSRPLCKRELHICL